MPYLPPDTPRPEPADRDEAIFWESCRERKLRIQKCRPCGRFRHPPEPICPSCRSMATEWVEVPGTGEVFSFTVAHHAVHPTLREAVPYNIAVVLLDEAGDVRLVSNVVDVAPDEIRVGLRVTLCWDALPDGGFLPRFRKA